MSLRTAAASMLLALAVAVPARSAGPPRGESVLDFLSVWLEMERKGAGEDVEDFDRATARLTRAEGDLTAAVQKLARMAREGTGDRQAVANAEDAVTEAESRVRGEQERRRVLSARLADRVRRISSLREEVLRRREAGRTADDPLSGRWDVTINPGPRRALFRLVLDGTLVWGDYTMDGGFRGSFRGTLVADRLFLERIDSERGTDARFWGRVVPSQRRITGTWEATALAPATGPVAGSWTAVPAKDPEDGD
ncbi:MAG TPA: hypothetical protein PK598_05965 [Thermoanaerobaculia bacterium]|nr:hypothetical protein [Thermoanaerobaculia bacterium]